MEHYMLVEEEETDCIFLHALVLEEAVEEEEVDGEIGHRLDGDQEMGVQTLEEAEVEATTALDQEDLELL